MITRREFQASLAGIGLASLSGTFGCESRREIPAAGQSAAGSEPKSISIGMIAKSQSNPVFLAARKGAESRAAALSKELGIDVTLNWRTPNDEDAQKQAEFIEQLVAQGVDAITIACSDAAKVTRSIDDAIARGVTVMCFDSDAPNSKRLCYVGTDDVDAGKQVMANVAKLLGDKQGVVAILAGNQTATNLQKRVRGAEAELKQHSHLKLDAVYYHKETPQDAYAEVESVQKAKSEVNAWAMIGGWPLMTDRKLPWEPGSVVCVSMDTLPAELEHIRMGDVQMLLGQRYFYFGERCVDLLVDKIRDGKDPGQTIEFAPLDIVTRENVDEYARNWAKWS
jgi:ribose transport system substrate-binding protein